MLLARPIHGVYCYFRPRASRLKCQRRRRQFSHSECFVCHVSPGSAVNSLLRPPLFSELGSATGHWRKLTKPQ